MVGPHRCFLRRGNGAWNRTGSEMRENSMLIGRLLQLQSMTGTWAARQLSHPCVSASQVLGRRARFPEGGGVDSGLPVTGHLVAVAGVLDHMRP